MFRAEVGRTATGGPQPPGGRGLVSDRIDAVRHRRAAAWGGGGPQFVPEHACAPQAATRTGMNAQMSPADLLNFEFRILNHEFAVPNGTAAARSRPLAEGCSSTSQAPPLGCGLVPSLGRSARAERAAASRGGGPLLLIVAGDLRRLPPEYNPEFAASYRSRSGRSFAPRRPAPRVPQAARACASQAAARSSCMQRANLNYEFRILNSEFVPERAQQPRTPIVPGHLAANSTSETSSSPEPPPGGGLHPRAARKQAHRSAPGRKRERTNYKEPNKPPSGRERIK